MKVVEIKDAGHSIGVVPDLGGGLAWFRSHVGCANATWSWFREPLAGHANGVLELACFPLAPFSNRIADAQFNFADQRVTLEPNFPPEPHAIHGVAWQSTWQILSQSPAEITLGLDWRGNHWPWNFDAQITYQLDEQGLCCTLRLINRDTCTMPSGLGWHPYFDRTRGVTLQAPARGIVLNDDRMLPSAVDWQAPVLDIVSNGKPLPIGLDNELVDWDGIAIIQWPELKRGLKILSEPCTNWAVLFTPSDEEYFCFEPVTHLTNAHNACLSGLPCADLVELAPGEMHQLSVHFTPIVDPT